MDLIKIERNIEQFVCCAKPDELVALRKFLEGKKLIKYIKSFQNKKCCQETT